MIIYNVTVNVEDSIHDEWLQWMREVHVPEVMKTGMFTHHYFCKLLTTQPDETGVTYAIQYHCDHQDNYERYQKEFAPALQKDHSERYGEKVLAFRTLLQKI